MICQFSGNGVSQEGLQQKRGRDRSLRCTENRAARTVFWAVEDTAGQLAIKSLGQINSPKKIVIFGLILQQIFCRCLSNWNQEIFATNAQRPARLAKGKADGGQVLVPWWPKRTDFLKSNEKIIQSILFF